MPCSVCLGAVPSVARSHRVRSAGGAALSSAAQPARARSRAARTVCIAAGVEDASSASNDEAWQAAQRAAQEIRARQPESTSWKPSPASPGQKKSSNAELNHRYIDGGLQRDEGLPLSLARLPPGDATRDVGKPSAASSARSSKVQVSERLCSACNGSGFALSRGRRKGSTAVCLLCLGVGAVRCCTTRTAPKQREGGPDGVSGTGQ